MKAKNALALALCAGCAFSANAAVEGIDSSIMTAKREAVAGLQTKLGGHVFINAKTGEFVYNNPVQPTHGLRTDFDGDGIDDVWMNIDLDLCEPGLQDSFANVATNWNLDQLPIDTTLSVGATYLFFGDVAFDSEVGTISFGYWTNAPEFDTDSDGDADSSDEFGIAMGFYDGDELRGVDNASFNEVTGRVLAGGFNLINLPANDAGPTFINAWIVTIDLAALTFDTDSDGTPDGDLTFELGDTDGLTNATFGNAFIGSDTGSYYGGIFNGDGLPDTDLDLDGLHDFSWGIGVNHPLATGTSATGFISAGPLGGANGGSPFQVRPDRPDWRDNFHHLLNEVAAAPNAQGEDPTLTALFGFASSSATPGFLDFDPVNGPNYLMVGYGFGFSAFDPVNDTNNNGEPGGPIFDDRDGSTIAGFNCDLPAQYLAANGGAPAFDLGGGPEGPLNQMYLGLSAIQDVVPPNPCLAIDLDGNGSKTFADVQLFIQAFGAQNAAADIDGNGIINFADAQLFISLFNGCDGNLNPIP